METTIKEKEGEKITTPKDVFKLLEKFKKEEKELFFVIYLNTQSIMKKAEIEFIGGWDTTIIDIKPILKKALINTATRIIVAHNHPSGSLKFSKEDKETTRKLREGCKAIGMELLDHVLISEEGFESMRETEEW